MRIGYNSYGDRWTPLRTIRELEVEERGNEWFDDSELDLDRTLAIWVTRDPRDAVFYLFPPEFRDAVLNGRLDLEFLTEDDDLYEDFMEFLGAMKKPQDFVTAVNLSGAIPVLETLEQFAEEYLYIKPVKQE